MSHQFISLDFKVSSAEQFKESLTEPANTILYLFYGNHIPFDQTEDGGTDNSPPVFDDSVDSIHYNTYANMIGGKQVTNSDVVHMVNSTEWTSGTKYEMYDDQKDHLSNTNFFVWVQEQSGYNVFKCLDNNNGVNSTAQPSLSETAATDAVYITEEDGYQWKYMYTISTVNYDKFATASYIPITANTAVTGNAVAGTLQTIKVIDAGKDYSAYANGFVTEFGVAGDSKLISISGTTTSIFQVSPNTSGFVKEEVKTRFVEFLRIQSGGKGYLTTDSVTVTTNGATVAATANIASVDANGAITGVNLLTRGKSYPGTTVAQVTVTSNTGGTGANAAANITASMGTSNGVIVDSNSTHLTVSSIQGIINTEDELTGVSSSTSANITAVTQQGDNLSSNTDFYKGSSFYIESGDGAGELGIIDEYIVTANEKRVLLASAPSANFATNSKFAIGPQVIITGDGTGAKARAMINSNLNSNTVANVQVINVGSGYTYANISIQGNTGFVTNAVSNSYISNTATARAIISPPGGHGSNVNSELFGNKIGISVSIANTAGGKLSANNDFREVGILKDPLFANGTLVLSSSETNFSAGELITGATSNATAIVVSANAAGIAMSNVRGFFTTETITGNASPAGNAVVSGVTQPTTHFRQTFKYTANVAYGGTAGNGLTFDEKVSQSESQASGFVLAHPGNADGDIELSNVRNTFLLSDVSGGDKYFTGANSAAQFKLTGVTLPEVTSGSGQIIYKENLKPITRSTAQTETFKLIIEF